jgi:hypothetical protein
MGIGRGVPISFHLETQDDNAIGLEGVFPKLLFRDTGELTILQHTHLFAGQESVILSLVGLGEIAFGYLLIWIWYSQPLLLLNILLLVVLGAGALFSQPRIFVAPFNPLTLNLAMAALSVVGLMAAHDLPSARSCRRRRPEKQP